MFIHTYQDRDGGFRVELLFGGEVATLTVSGTTSTQAASELVRVLDRLDRDVRPAEGALRVMVDISAMRGGSLRAQAPVGKWLFKHRKSYGAVAFVGAGPQRGIARAVMRVARLPQVSYFDTPPEALDWLTTAAARGKRPAGPWPRGLRR